MTYSLNFNKNRCANNSRLVINFPMLNRFRTFLSHSNEIRVISDFFNDSTKRYERFLEVLKTCMPDNETVNKLIDICRTRWIERIEGMRRFKEAYKATYTALETISKNQQFHGTVWNVESKTTATSLCLLMKNFVAAVMYLFD